MDIRILKYFVAVCEEGNITRAARVLHTSQPNLSKQLHDLELEIGKDLFVKGTKRIVLTDEGNLLRKRALEIIELFDKTENELMYSYQEVSGDVKIGAAETDAMRLVAKAIKKTRNQYRGITFDITSGNADDAKERLNKGLIDFAIMIEPNNLDDYEYLEFPVKDQFVVVMRKDDELANKEYITSDDLNGKNIMCTKQIKHRGNLMNWLGDQSNVILTYNLITTPAMLVEEGMGYAFSLDKLVTINESTKLTFKPLKPKVEYRIFLVWKKYQIFSKAGSIFLDNFRALLDSYAQ